MARNRIFAIAARAPWLARLLLWAAWGRVSRDRAKLKAVMGRYAQELTGPDQAAYADPKVMSIMVDSIAEAYRQGSRGQAHESALLGRAWGFRLEDIRCDKVYLWHGELDPNVPVAAGRAVGAAIPHCQTVCFPDEGHISILVNRRSEILRALTSSLAME
ncbi:MAG TPA: hypothetical protein VJ793_13365 [Anaerolineae bacterium]|nr:hypothetical protein [Anaerolineae bacterium]